MRLLVILALIFVVACQKSGKGYVKGTVTESSTGNPIEGVPVYVILETKEAKGLSTFFYDTISRSLTGADGTYKINYRNSRGWKYKNYVSTGLIKNFTHGNFGVELVYKKAAVNFNLY